MEVWSCGGKLSSERQPARRGPRRGRDGRTKDLRGKEPPTEVFRTNSDVTARGNSDAGIAKLLAGVK